MPGIDRIPTTSPSVAVTDIETFTPNSYAVRALSLAMHSPTGACVEDYEALSPGRLNTAR